MAEFELKALITGVRQAFSRAVENAKENPGI